MKIEVKSLGEHPYTTLEAEISGKVTLSKVFSGIGIRTEGGALFGIAQRDSGLEITCPDGTHVGVKIYEGGERVCHGMATNARKAEKGEAFIERNGEVIG